MLNEIKNTLRRLSGKIYIFNPVTYFPLLLEGIAVEINRFKEFKDQIYSSTVPDENMSVESIDDYNRKYGIPSYIGGTDVQKVCRIIEKASLNGEPGPDFLEEQIQLAGFQLYVILNEPQEKNIVKYNTVQYSPSVQYGLTSRFVDPDDIPGILVVGSPPSGSGRIYVSQYKGVQYSSSVQYATINQNALNPQPVEYTRLDDPTMWGYYFTLSPFADRVATDESEFLEVTETELQYLKQIIIELKLQRNRCILQAKSA